MKSIRIHSFGDSGQLKMEEIPRPSPENGEVLVAIRSAGVNPVDWKIREGMLGKLPGMDFPLVVGQDFAGEVVESNAAPNESGRFKAGDRVFGFARGAYAEFAAVPADAIAHLPDRVSFEVGASLPTPGVTAYQLVMKAAAIESGQSVLIHGAAGAVGSLATQLALHRGARVIATDRGRDVDYLKELGVERVIDTRQERFEDAGKVDAVLDLVGGDLLRRSYDLVREGGVLATTVGQVDDSECHKRSINGVSFRMQRNPADLEELADLVDQGALRPRIYKVLPFPAARQAQEISEHGETHGKVLLKVA